MRMGTTQRTMPMYSFKGRGFTLRGQCLHSVQQCAKYKQGSATLSPYHQCYKIKEATSLTEKICRTAASCKVEYVNWLVFGSTQLTPVALALSCCSGHSLVLFPMAPAKSQFVHLVKIIDYSTPGRTLIETFI